MMLFNKIKKIMKKIFILLIFSYLVIWYTISAYYHPNSVIWPYLKDVTEKFITITSYSNTNSDNIPTSLFSQLAQDFGVLKNKLPQDNPNFKVIYENCYLASTQLSKKISSSKLSTFYSQCFWPWKKLTREIETKYSIKANIKAYPGFWNAPLTVTLDWRWSIDPSADTIPTDNYFWYYKDSNWNEKLIWRWPVIKYTFNRPNTYIVHLTVRSVNKWTKWILDWKWTTTISVAPAIAKMVMYINWKKATTDNYVKLSSEEWKIWVLFDASWTTPKWWTKIASSSWLVTHNNKIIFKKTIPDYPWAIRVKLMENWFYFATLTIKDNTGKIVKKTYKVIVSNPVSLIKVSPKIWNTSTTFSIDWSASYSVKWKISSYKWTLIWNKWNIIDTFQWKKSFKYKFIIPWDYSIKLEVIDIEWNKNSTSYKLHVDSTSPSASFVFNKYDNWKKPSIYIFDASYSYDIDSKIWDTLTYIWNFSDSKNVKIQYINNWEKIIAKFEKKWIYKVTLTVKDKYWKTASITKEIKILSTLRPKIYVKPNYSILWNPVGIQVKTNKQISYYEYYFWDKKTMKTKVSSVAHTYLKIGVYKLTVRVYSTDWDSNSVTTNVFIWQRWYPLAKYKVLKNRMILTPNTYCKISCKWEKWCKFIPAYKISRLENITIDARNSMNSQWTTELLKIYFEKFDSNQYIISSDLNVKFDELWCKKITLYAKDLNNNKVDKKEIYFKVVDALPVLKDLKMYFPQYWGSQNWVFTPNIWKRTIPKDIFALWFDPLLIKLTAIWAYDPDSPMLSYYRWYFYKKWDKSNLIDVKITPYNIPEVVFALSRIPWEYIFWVDICDVDWKCTNSEDYLHLKPIVNIPPSNDNPNIPQVNSVRIDHWTIKWVWEINVWNNVSIHVDTSVLSKKPDFRNSRVLKYDFNNDWKYDLTTKSDSVSYVYTKPWKYRVKVKVLYRWYAGIWYSSPIIVKKWLKPMVDINYKWKDLIFNDLSMWNIKEKDLCFNLRACRKKPKIFLFKTEKYWYVNYSTTWTKLLFLRIKDEYWNEKSIRKKIIIKNYSWSSYLLTLPKAEKEWNNYKLTLAWLYRDNFILYYKSNYDNCYIDKDISIDTNNDWSTANDKDLVCNHIYKLSYTSTPKVILMIHENWEKKKIVVDFTQMEDLIPKKFKTQYEQIQQLIYKYSDSDDDKIKYFLKIMSDLISNLNDVTNRDAILLQLNNFISKNKWLLDEKDETTVESIISTLSDIATNAALSKDDSVFTQNKQEILLIMSSSSDEVNDKLNNLFSQLEQSSSKDERKKILQNIMDIALKEKKTWNIDDGSIQMIKTDICWLLKYYEIPSKLCLNNLKNVPVSWSWFSIVKIILYVLWAVVLLFVILIIIFVFKAKKRRLEQEYDNDEDENDEDENDDNDDNDEED